MEVIQGYVEHIVFRNEDNGYTVFHLNNDDGDLTCVGNFNYIAEGAVSYTHLTLPTILRV